jgi:VWFA-related protein
MRKTALALVLAAGFWSPAVGAIRQDQDPRPTFRASVGRVAVSAVVRTKQGRPVTDLTAKDFQLIDRGQIRSITEFRSDPSPVRLSMLVDFSGSMDVAEKRAAAHESAFHLLSWLTAGKDEVSLYAFDREIMELQPPAPSPADVLQKLDSLKPYGATSLFDAIAETGKLVADRGQGRRAVVALTDGADNASKLTPEQVSTLASAIDVPVYIIIIVSPLDRAGSSVVNEEQVDEIIKGKLGDLARWTGGEIFAAIGPAQASRAARQIVTELRHQYLIAFEPGTEPGWHPIELRTIQKDLVVRTRSGYVVRSRPSARPVF